MRRLGNTARVRRGIRSILSLVEAYQTDEVYETTRTKSDREEIELAVRYLRQQAGLRKQQEHNDAAS